MILDESRYTWSTWQQPIMTSNTTWGKLSASSVNSGGHEPYVALDGSMNTQWENATNVFPADFIWEFEKPLKISKITLTNKKSSGAYLSKTVKVYAEKEKTTLLYTDVFAKSSQSVVTINFTQPVCLDMIVFEFPDTYSSHAGLSEIVFAADVGEEIPKPDKAYLISDKQSKYYTYTTSGDLTEVTIGSLNAEAFEIHGFEVIPPSSILKQLVNPTLLYWQRSQDSVPSFKANIKAIPPVQMVYTENKTITEARVVGIEKVIIDADASTLFAFSFDNGNTWKAWNGTAWITLSDATDGMTKAEVEAISIASWKLINWQKQCKVRFSLFEGGYCKSITIHYLTN